MHVCVLFVSSTSDIIFNLCAGEITDHSQSVKDLNPNFKFQQLGNCGQIGNW